MAGQSGVEIPSYGQDSVVLVGMVGDVNSDGEYNVLDIVSLINFILLVQEPDDYGFWASDLNGDNSLNVFKTSGAPLTNVYIACDKSSIPSSFAELITSTELILRL